MQPFHGSLETVLVKGIFNAIGSAKTRTVLKEHPAVALNELFCVIRVVEQKKGIAAAAVAHFNAFESSLIILGVFPAFDAVVARRNDIEGFLLKFLICPDQKLGCRYWSPHHPPPAGLILSQLSSRLSPQSSSLSFVFFMTLDVQVFSCRIMAGS
jgi:hypothetical protein